MSSYKINFDGMEWTDAGNGMRYKVYKNGNQQLRLIEFSEGFVESDWCTNGHTGVVLEGSFSTDFNGYIERFVKGDITHIPSGEADKHKAILGKGEKVVLLLFELMED